MFYIIRKMEETLKTQFPNFIINNASNRNSYELLKITELCHKIDKFLVFIKRNEKNEEYFKLTEELQNVEKINVIFLNKDDIYFYDVDDEHKIDIVVMSLKRKILKSTFYSLSYSVRCVVLALPLTRLYAKLRQSLKTSKLLVRH